MQTSHWRSAFGPLAVVLVGLSTHLACIRSESDGPKLPPQPIAAPSPTRDPSEGQIIELAVPEHEPAMLYVPKAAGSAKPVLVATHGAGDRADWHCQYWRPIVQDRAFILCPQGRRMMGGDLGSQGQPLYYYPNHLTLQKELEASLQALQARYQQQVDTSRALYTGFSQGAIHGALVVMKHPELFPRAVLIEGGVDQWNIPLSQSFKQNGGERIVFACGQLGCRQKAVIAARYLGQAEVPVQVVFGQGAGHTNGGAVESEIRKVFDWVIEDDARWKP